MFSLLLCDDVHPPKIRSSDVVGLDSEVSYNSTLSVVFLLPYQRLMCCPVQCCHIVPPIALFLAKHPIVSNYDLSSVVAWGCGAAPLGTDLVELVEARTGVKVRSGYGMSETTCVIATTPGWNAKRGTVGTIVANMTAKLVPVGGRVEADGRGELWLKGPQVMKGYWRNPAATQETFDAEGWMRTGDVCVIDQDGDMFIVDRVKELIKYKGFQVPPAGKPSPPR